MESALWKRFTQGEKDFFQFVWSKRVISSSLTFRWLIRIGVQLIGRSTGLARFYYVYLVPMLWLVAALCLPLARTRRFITGYLNDIRLYLEPLGDLEHAIVQHIDHLVGERYLRLLGVDWNLDITKSLTWDSVKYRTGRKCRTEKNPVSARPSTVLPTSTSS